MKGANNFILPLLLNIVATTFASEAVIEYHLGESCTTDDDCVDILDATRCKDGICDCSDKYIGNFELGCYEPPTDERRFDGLLTSLVDRFTHYILLSAMKYDGNFVFSPLGFFFDSTMLLAFVTNPSETRTILLTLFSDYDDIDAMERSIKFLITDYKKNLTKTFISNAAWSPLSMEEDMADELVKSMSEIYGMDYMFVNDSSTTLPDVINTWISEKTNGKVTKVIDTVEPNFKLVVVNAIYFKDDWKQPFQKVVKEEDKNFKLLNGATKSVRMMSTTMYAGPPVKMRMTKTLSMNVFSINYKTSGYRMVFMVPETPRQFIAVEKYLNDLIASLDFSFILTERVRYAMARPRYWKNITVFVPEFDVTSSMDFKQIFQDNGVTTIFEDGVPSRAVNPLKLNEIKQGATISVNTEGTEAAAATSIETDDTFKDSTDGLEFRINQPFFFLIHDPSRDLPVFFGRVVDPNYN